MHNDLDVIKSKAGEEIANASGLKDIHDLKVKYLGKKGVITTQLKTLGTLPKEEKKRRELLSLRKATLEKIKEAKEKKADDAEMYNSMVYGMLTSWWGKHPYLMHLMVNARLRGMRY